MRERQALLAIDALLLDLAAYLVAVQLLGPAGEANPVVLGLPGQGAVVAAKLAQAAAAGAIVWWLAGRPYRRVRAVAYLPAVVGLFGAATAVLAVWHP